MKPLAGPYSIIDTHQHFWSGGAGYHATAFLPDDYLALATGTGVEATVFAECRTHYDESLPADLQSTGETRFAASIGAAHADTPVELAAAILAHADPFAGHLPFDAILDAHTAVAGGRLRGIRRCVAWDEDDRLNYAQLGTWRNMLGDPRARQAARTLADRGLLFEVWLYHPQIDELTTLARAVPQCRFVLNHAGTPLASGRHAGAPDTIGQWREAMARLAEQGNVHVKLGGLVTPGTTLDARRTVRGLGRWTAAALAEELAPYMSHLLDRFGADRCLFESNFPVDQAHCDFDILLSAYLATLTERSEAERAAVMGGNAWRLYALGRTCKHNRKEERNDV
ncbi:Predicted metal-dependent hydrolase, TIM-barrel fold [Sphingobium faniae]|nr:Predicted metal-dependent hydrolase, TIM-barrel fold [Sphingobium faniae]